VLVFKGPFFMLCYTEFIDKNSYRKKL